MKIVGTWILLDFRDKCLYTDETLVPSYKIDRDLCTFDLCQGSIGHPESRRFLWHTSTIRQLGLRTIFVGDF